ncbi:MAG: TonB-dependent receptor [Gammaproteobacteria bacterium]|nr:TonB-dependent receptor [Gammaproteobacteria bacterium]
MDAYCKKQSSILCQLCMGFMVALFSHAAVSAEAFLGADDELFVSIATGQSKSIKLAPAVTTVVTAAEITAMGATTLSEVLESVPGLHVSANAIGYGKLYLTRGIYSEYNPQFLVLIDGQPVTGLQFGNRGFYLGEYSIYGIERVEILRGPASAVYGADAFSGIVNIITKNVEDIDKTELGVAFGSFESKEAWILAAHEWQGLKFAYSLTASSSDGSDQIIESDAQSNFDSLYGTQVSYAPGSVNAASEKIAGHLKINYNDWNARLDYQVNQNVGMGAGVASALDPLGKGDAERYLAELSYGTNVSDVLKVSSFLNYLNLQSNSFFYLFPAGVNFNSPIPPLNGDYFPEGVFGELVLREHHMRFESSAFYSGFENQNWRVGAGYLFQDMYHVEERKNFYIQPNGIPGNLGSVVDYSDNNAFLPETDRRVQYTFLQNEWQLYPDWELTAGVRYDRYSDFGDTTNPRLALVWQAAYDLTFKVLYSEAFRPPSFSEQFNINNPVALGNPNLKPEEINTIELVVDYSSSDVLRHTFNIFQYKANDLIQFIPDAAPATSKTAQNIGEQSGYGVEYEWNWRIDDVTKIKGNIAWQHSVQGVNDDATIHSPALQAYLQANRNWLVNFDSGMTLKYVADRERVSYDARAPIDDYVTVDGYVAYSFLNCHKSRLTLHVKNIFDEDIKEPSVGSVPPVPTSIPDDLPMSGRSFLLTLKTYW